MNRFLEKYKGLLPDLSQELVDQITKIGESMEDIWRINEALDSGTASQSEIFDLISATLPRRRDDPVLWNERRDYPDCDQPTMLRFQIEALQNECRGWLAIREIVRSIREVPTLDRLDLGVRIDEYVTQIIAAIDLCETQWKMMTHKSDKSMMKTAWLMVNFPRLHLALPVLMQNGFIKDVGDYYNWTDKQTLLADLFRNMGGQNAEIADYFRIRNEPIKPKSLKAAIGKGDSHEYYRLKAIIPELSER